MIDTYKSYDSEKRSQFLKLILKPDTDIQSIEFPCLTNYFKEEVQVIFSLLSQVLGLDHDKEVSKIMLSFLVVYYEAEKSKNMVIVAFDQFLSESIHEQFINFWHLQKFKY